MTRAQVTIVEQLECARRELRLRKACYPRWVNAGRMSAQESEREMRSMEAIVETLEELAQHKTPRLL